MFNDTLILFPNTPLELDPSFLTGLKDHHELPNQNPDFMKLLEAAVTDTDHTDVDANYLLRSLRYNVRWCAFDWILVAQYAAEWATDKDNAVASTGRRVLSLLEEVTGRRATTA